MKDPKDEQTAELLPTATTKAQRFRAKQLELGKRQFSFWLTESESQQIKAFVEYMQKREGAK